MFDLEKHKRAWEQLPDAEKARRRKEMEIKAATSRAVVVSSFSAPFLRADIKIEPHALRFISPNPIDRSQWDNARKAEEKRLRDELLERQNFSIANVDALRVQYLVELLSRAPLDVYQAVKTVADLNGGKYSRGTRLIALMFAAGVEGRRLADTGQPFAPTPVRLKHARREIARMIGDYDRAVEYSISDQCSTTERANRATALVLLIMERAYGEAIRDPARSLPALTESPSASTGKPRRKRTDGATAGKRKQGNETRDAVKKHLKRYSSAGSPIDVAAKEKIAASVRVTPRRVGQIIAELSKSPA
jgi:hypothetical protein